MNKYQVIGLVILVVITFFMVNSDQVFAVSTYKNSTGTSCTGGSDFTCPLDLSNLTSASVFPKRIAGVGTDNGYFTIWQQNVTSTDLRLFYASTKDGITGTTPLDISGQLGGCPSPCQGIDEDQMFIFEDNGTIDIFFIEIANGVQQSSSEIFHARSTNGGTSFTTKTSIVLDAPFYFPIVDGNTLAIIHKDTNTNRILFKNSTDGGTTFGSGIFMDGGANECNEPKHPIRMTKDGSTFHVAWYGLNAQNTSNNAVCYNQSTNSGLNWSSSVQILSEQVFGVGDINESNGGSTIFPNVFPAELEIYVDTTNPTRRINILWENVNEDVFFNALSTDSGVSFGSQTTALDTTTAGQDTGCTDPVPLAVSWGFGDVHDYVGSDNIFISCTGNPVNWAIKRSLDHGQTYNLAQSASDDVSGGRFSFADDPLGFAREHSTDFAVFAVSEDASPSRMQFVFSSDNGVTYNNSTTMFMTTDTPRALTGNVSNVWLGFQHTQDTGVSNNWVSTFSTGLFPPVPPPPDTPPVITILGDNPAQILLGQTYTDAGATCNDAEDGDLTSSIITVENVNTAVLGSGTVTYTCTDSDTNLVQAIREVLVVEQITTTVTTGGGAGAPVGSVDIDTGIEGFTPEQQEEFDQAVAEAIASIEPSEGNIVESIIQTFFEFIVIDKVHDELQLQSFLDDQRLGFRWSTGDDLIIVSATPALSPFMFTFEQFPAIRQGSGAFVSTNFILYNLEVPRAECTATISINCVEKIRYEIPVTLNAIINGTQVSDTGTITVDLTEDEIDPILLIILSLFTIPIIGVIIQRSRGRSSIEPLRRVLS